MASKIFFSHQKVYFWISAFDHRAIVLDKMHIVHCSCVATEIFTFLTTEYPSQLKPSVPTALPLSHWSRTIDPSVQDP